MHPGDVLRLFLICKCVSFQNSHLLVKELISGLQNMYIWYETKMRKCQGKKIIWLYLFLEWWSSQRPSGTIFLFQQHIPVHFLYNFHVVFFCPKCTWTLTSLLLNLLNNRKLYVPQKKKKKSSFCNDESTSIKWM